MVPNVLSCLVCQNFLFFCKVLLSRLSMRMIKYFGSCCFGLSRQISALWLQIYQIISKFWIKRTKIINLRLFFVLLWYFKNCQLCAIQTLVANLTVLIWNDASNLFLSAWFSKNLCWGGGLVSQKLANEIICFNKKIKTHLNHCFPVFKFEKIFHLRLFFVQIWGYEKSLGLLRSSFCIHWTNFLWCWNFTVSLLCVAIYPAMLWL